MPSNSLISPHRFLILRGIRKGVQPPAAPPFSMAYFGPVALPTARCFTQPPLFFPSLSKTTGSQGDKFLAGAGLAQAGPSRSCFFQDLDLKPSRPELT
jgi:hypothetical protein